MLITELEAAEYSPGGKAFPRKLICENISVAEDNLRDKCLGQELWDYLVSKLNTTQTNSAEEWIACGDYSIDDVVKRNGFFFISTSDNNNTDPSQPGTDWELVKKFTDNCCNELWEKFLRKVLAYRVYYYALPFTVATPTPGGLTVTSGDSNGQRGANMTEINRIQQSVQEIVESVLISMKTWSLQTAQANCGFPSSPALGSCSDCETSSSSSGFVFKMRSR